MAPALDSALAPLRADSFSGERSASMQLWGHYMDKGGRPPHGRIIR